MTYDEHDAAMDEFHDRISDELYPEHKEIAIDEFIEERMQSYFLKHPNIIDTPMKCYRHANELIDVSPQGALVFYTTAIELFLKSVLLKPVLYGMIHNDKVADMIVDATTSQSGFSRYNKLLTALCSHAANINLAKIDGRQKKPIINEAEEVQKIRNRIVHRGYKASINEMGNAKSLASLILTEVVEPVINNLNLKIETSKQKFEIQKC